MIKEAAIGDALVRTGLIDSSGLSRAREVQEQKGVSLGKALAALGLADEEAVSAAIAKKLQLELLDTELPEVVPEVAALLPIEFCCKRMVAPLSLVGNSLRLALADPLDYSTIQDVEFRTNKQVVAVVACQSLIQTLLNRIYPPEDRSQQNLLAVAHPAGEVEAVGETDYEVVDPAKLTNDVKLPPVVRLANLILSCAAKAGASDIHLEPKENHLQVRQRVDGLLRDVLKVPRSLKIRRFPD